MENNKRILVLSIIAVLIVILSGIGVGYSIYKTSEYNNKKDNPVIPEKKEKSNDEILKDVMYGIKPFVDESDNKIMLKEYLVGGVDSAYPQEYAYVDLDGDGVNELAVLLTSSYGEYLIFHMYEGEVYGYAMGVRAFGSVNSDGLFMGSDGASDYGYYKMKFNGKDKEIETVLESHDTEGIYRINGEDVTKEAVEEYVTSISIPIEFIKY